MSLSKVFTAIGCSSKHICKLISQLRHPSKIIEKQSYKFIVPKLCLYYSSSTHSFYFDEWSPVHVDRSYKSNAYE